MKQAEDDVQAGNFPMLNKERFIPLTELKENVKELLGDNYWPEVDLTKEELAQRIGIKEEMYVDFLAERQVLDAHIDTMIIVQAKEAYVGGGGAGAGRLPYGHHRGKQQSSPESGQG